METSLLCPPKVCWESKGDVTYRPSWSKQPGYINAQHTDIWQRTQEIPGHQLPADSAKLYEMAYFSGSVMLEIGTMCGRSAVVELRGALDAQAAYAKPAPQFYGVDVNLSAITRTYQTLQREGVSDRALLFHGNLLSFHHHYRITPSMVFVDGDHEYPGVWSDLDLLRTFLAPGTPVLCHDFYNEHEPGVRRAVDEWVNAGLYEKMGLFGCSILLRASGRCTGRVHGLPPDQFDSERAARLFGHLNEVVQANGELQRQVNELASSRWRQFGMKLGIAKPASWERAKLSA